MINSYKRTLTSSSDQFLLFPALVLTSWMWMCTSAFLAPHQTSLTIRWAWNWINLFSTRTTHSWITFNCSLLPFSSLAPPLPPPPPWQSPPTWPSTSSCPAPCPPCAWSTSKGQTSQGLSPCHRDHLPGHCPGHSPLCEGWNEVLIQQISMRRVDYSYPKEQ